jgi:hypothetical protein
MVSSDARLDGGSCNHNIHNNEIQARTKNQLENILEMKKQNILVSNHTITQAN